jgi:ketosteroid isomerase-like protein
MPITRPIRRGWIVAMLAVLATGGVPLAAASSDGDSERAALRPTAAEDPMVTDTRAMVDRFIELWNAKKLDELVAGHYVDDAVMLPPNHEPIRGRAAILAYLKSLRDFVGDAQEGDHLLQATPSDKTVSWVGLYVFGNLRITAHELYVRQPDGSMRNTVDMFGYRDPMR